MIPEPSEPDWLGVAYAEAANIYDAPFVERLCAQFPPSPGAELTAIQEGLISAGAIYLTKPNTGAQPGEWRQRLSQLGRVSKHAKELADELDALSPHVSQLLASLEGGKDLLSMIEAVHLRSESDVNVPSERVLRHECNLNVGNSSLSEALRELETTAETALLRIRETRPKGAPRRDALGTWTINMEQTWTCFFGQRFTLSQKDGPSAALRFCLAVMAPLDPAVEQGTIANKMSEVIRFSRRIENRKKAPQSVGG